MKVVSYARIANDAELSLWKQRLERFVGEKKPTVITELFHDGLSGVREFKLALRKAAIDPGQQRRKIGRDAAFRH